MALGFVGASAPGAASLRVRCRQRSWLCNRRDGNLRRVPRRGGRVDMFMVGLRERVKEQRPLESLIASTSSDLVEVDDSFNRFNMLSIRAIADSSVSSVLYELCTSLYCASCLVTQFQMAFSHQLFQLVAGAILGVWTVSTTLRSMVAQGHAEEKRIEQKVGEESKSIAEQWVQYINSVDGMLALSPLMYSDESNDIDDEQEVEMALTWLSTMDENEGKGTLRLIDKTSRHPNKNIRLQLAKCMQESFMLSNAVVNVLQTLARDTSPEVVAEARAALHQLKALGLNIPDVAVKSGEGAEAAGVPALSPLCSSSAKMSALDEERMQPRTKVELSLDEARVALSRLLDHTVQLESALGAMRSGGLQAFNLGVTDFEKQTGTPLRKIGRLELHTLCVCSLFAWVHNLGCVFHFYDSPVRFLGLGWVFAVAGLAAYPRSAHVFDHLQRSWQEPLNSRKSFL